jgi:hypothetical protein
MTTFWAAFGAISTAATGIIILGSVYWLAKQIKELRLATYAQTFSTALDHIQPQEIRMSRRRLFHLQKQGLTLDKWTHEDKIEAEKVCQTYDVVGIMVRNGMLPKEIIIENWGHSILGCWNAASGLVEQYRVKGNTPELWDDFQWIANEVAEWKSKYQSPSRRVG